MVFQTLILAFSLSFDAFGIGFSYGIRDTKISFLGKLIVFCVSIFISAISVTTGVLIASFLPMWVVKWLGVALLIVLGLYVIYQGIRKETSFDLDNSNSIEPLEALYLGAGLSIDSVGACIASVALGFNMFLVPVAISVCQLLFLCVGIFFGKKFLRVHVNSKVISLISGTVIIAVAIVRAF